MEITATAAAKRFSDVLDAVEHRGETFTIVRRGRVIATLAPAARPSGATLRRILDEHPPDGAWARDHASVREFIESAPQHDPWTD